MESPGPDKEPGAQAPILAEKLWDIEQIQQLKARYFRFPSTPRTGTASRPVHGGLRALPAAGGGRGRHSLTNEEYFASTI